MGTGLSGVGEGALDERVDVDCSLLPVECSLLISFYLLFLFLHLAGFLVFAQPLLLLVFPVAFLHLVRGNHVVRYMLDLGFRATFQYFFELFL